MLEPHNDQATSSNPGLRSRFAVPFVLIVALVGVFGVWRLCTLFMSLRSGPPTITVSEATTYVTGPLRPDGSVDFLAALNEHCRKGVTVENNAAIPFWQAVGPSSIPAELRTQFFTLLGIPPLPETGRYLVSFSDHIKAAEKAPSDAAPGAPDWQTQLSEQCEQAQTRPWSRDEFPAVARWLDANEKPLAVLAAGLRRPRFYSPLVAKGGRDGSVIAADCAAGLTAVREMLPILTTRAMLRTKQGKVEEAWQDLLAAHRLARLAGQGPLLVDWLVASACERAACSGDVALTHHAALTNDQIGRFRADLGGLPPLPPVADAFSFGERLLAIERICATSQTKPVARKFSDFFHHDGPEDTLTPLVTDPRVDWDRVLRVANERYDQTCEACRMPTFPERRARLAKLADEMDRAGAAARPGKTAGLAKFFPARKSPEELTQQVGDLLVAALCAANGAVVRVEMRSRVAADQRDMAWALAEYRNDRGEYPAKLKDLVPKYMPEIPQDPFAAASATDYHYLRRGTGYVLYSVGPDGRDDGGRNRSDDPKKYDLESDSSKIPDDIAIRTPEEKPQEDKSEIRNPKSQTNPKSKI